MLCSLLRVFVPAESLRPHPHPPFPALCRFGSCRWRLPTIFNTFTHAFTSPAIPAGPRRPPLQP